MSSVYVDYRRAFQLLLTFAAGLLFLMAMRFSAAEAASQSFVIPANDGYGVHECLEPGAACGQVVADALCEAHGLAKSVAFGAAEDVTASTGAPAK